MDHAPPRTVRGHSQRDRRNCADAMCVARNVVFDPKLAPGGGATEMANGVRLHANARSITGVEGRAVRAVADVMEGIPRTLVQNCGVSAIRLMTELRVRGWAGGDGIVT